jgi:hypothetical protein
MQAVTVVFAGEPLVRVTAPRIEAQLLEGLRTLPRPLRQVDPRPPRPYPVAVSERLLSLCSWGGGDELPVAPAHSRG